MTNPPLDAEQSQINPLSTLWLRTFDEIDGTDLPLIGGKAFRLAQLKQHGLNVPDGLVLTTTFFETQLQHHHLIPLWAGSPDIAVTPEALGWLADALKTKPLAKELTDALDVKLSMFDGYADSFAVRSSAIDEDQRDHSFPGVHLTELGVPRSALPIAITRCWASALSSTAIEYRQAHGMSIQSIRIAVLIQPMLSPASAGVGFTVNPLTGSRDELVIEGTWGLGEAVVSSNVQPHTYTLANQPADYPLIDEVFGNSPSPDGNLEQGPLSSLELTELAVQLEQIHALMGEPQDVEWAKQGDKFFILQTRPVVLPEHPPATIDWTWTRGNYREFLPELPSPMFSSLLERTQSQGVAVFQQLGFEVDEHTPYARLILGRPYLNLTFLKRVISQAGLMPGSLLYTIGHTEPGGTGRHISIDWSSAWRARRVYWRAFKQAFTMSGVVKEFQNSVDEVYSILNQPALDVPSTTLLSQFRQQERIYSRLFITNLKFSIAISTVTAMASRLLGPLTSAPASFVSVLALKEIKTVDSSLNEVLFNLAQSACRDEATCQYLLNAADDFADFADTTSISAEFRAAFDNLLEQYGEHAMYETDMGRPRYQEDPASLLGVIRQFVQSKGDEESNNDLPISSTVDWDQLDYQGFNRIVPWRRWLAAPFVRLLRRLLIMRDSVNVQRARAMAVCRRWNLALGQHWTDKGWLTQPEDVSWLTLDEIERTLMVEENRGITLPVTVQARKETYETYADTAMPFTVKESEIALIQPGVGFTPADTTDVMVGLPVSPGQTRGRVVVLQNPHDYQKSDDDIILVLPSTDPTWLPLLRLAAGLIVEMGGLLSHGSVIAREYGLPAVANIPDATRRFHTGDTVLVDGSTGVVQILETAQSLPAEHQNIE
jgi:pyruvate,water dikinase